MSAFWRYFVGVLFHLGYLGPLLLGVLDSSFLFLPFGNDILLVVLVARHHQAWLWYVLSAVCGSTLGVFLLDLAARKIGESGVQKVAGPSRFAYLKRKIGENGGKAVALGSLAPPPFPFTMVAATLSALAYPRRKLLAIVALCRLLRFLILGYLALRFGREILRIITSAPFRWSITGLAVLCIIGSAFSLFKWLKRSPSK